MSAPNGNKFWERRSTHGRKRIFATPDILWESACEYFEDCQAHPLPEHDYVGKDAKEVTKNKLQAFTIHGLCVFLGVNTKYFNDFEDSLKNRKDKKAIDFSEVITRIKDVIFVQKFTGAAAGLLNPNIIARETGLQDKQGVDHTTNGKDMPAPVSNITFLSAEKMTDEQIQQYLNKDAGANNEGI